MADSISLRKGRRSTAATSTAQQAAAPAAPDRLQSLANTHVFAPMAALYDKHRERRRVQRRRRSQSPSSSSGADEQRERRAGQLDVEGVDPELLKLVARFAPLELAVFKRPEPAQLSAQPSASASVRSEQQQQEQQGPPRSSSAGGSRRTTGGSSAAVPSKATAQPAAAARPVSASHGRTKEREQAPPGQVPAWRSSEIARHRSESPPGLRASRKEQQQQLHGQQVLPSNVTAALPVRNEVKRDPKILPNPVEERRAEQQQRQAKVSTIVSQLKEKVEKEQKRREQRAKAQAELLKKATAPASQAALEAAAEPAPVQVQMSPKKKRKPKADAKASEDEGKKGPRDPKAYERPWQKNMRDPGAGPPPLARADALASRPPAELAVALDAPPPVAGAIGALVGGITGPAGQRSLSPGPVRVRDLDPAARAELAAFMERKRIENEKRAKEEKEAEERKRLGMLRVAKEEAAKAREDAKRFADEAAMGMHPTSRPKPAWVDVVVPEQGMDADDTARPTSVQRARADASLSLRNRLQPDVDAMSLRAMPNSTTRALAREAQGAKVRVVSRSDPRRSQSATARRQRGWSHTGESVLGFERGGSRRGQRGLLDGGFYDDDSGISNDESESIFTASWT